MTLLNVDRYSTTGVVLRKMGVVVHDSESPTTSHDGLVAAMQRPGDRPLGGGRMYGSGYHAISDGLGGYTVLADASQGPYAAPPCNKTWWHICIPGFASQTAQDWLSPTNLLHITGVARFIIDVHAADGVSWPLVYRTAADLVKGLGGITAHSQVSAAWHQSDHTDVGSSFPWDLLASEIVRLSTPLKPSIPIDPPPTEDTDMLKFLEADGMPLVLVVGATAKALQNDDEKQAVIAFYGDIPTVRVTVKQFNDLYAALTRV